MSNLPLPSEPDLPAAYTGQPDLFAGLDVSKPTVRAARRFLHSGTTTAEDEEAAAKIIGAAALGWSVRRIARELGHSRNTVAAVLDLAEQAGKVEPVAKRVLQAAGESIHSDLEWGNDLVEDARAHGVSDKKLSAIAALRRSTWVAVKELSGAGTPQDRPAVAVQVNVSGLGAQVAVSEYAKRLQELQAGAAAPGAGPDSQSGAAGPESSANSPIEVDVMPRVMPPSPNTIDPGIPAAIPGVSPGVSAIPGPGVSTGGGGGCRVGGGAMEADANKKETFNEQ